MTMTHGVLNFVMFLILFLTRKLGRYLLKYLISKRHRLLIQAQWSVSGYQRLYDETRWWLWSKWRPCATTFLQLITIACWSKYEIGIP